MQITNKRLVDYQRHASSVSLAKLYELLDIEPTPLQKAMIELFDDNIEDWNELNISASRRYGKTFSTAILIVRELLIVNSSTMAISKSSKAVSVLFNEVLRLLRVLGIKPTKINSNSYMIQVNESVFRATPYKTVDTLLGNSATLIVGDEIGTYNVAEEMAITLLPMRNDAGAYTDTNMFVSKVVRISSPRAIGSDYYYDFIKGLEGRPKDLEKGKVYISPKGICSLNYDIYSSPLVTPQLVESLKQSTDEDVWKTEYLAKFIHMGAASAFSQFEQRNNTFNLSKLIKSVGGNIRNLGFNLECLSEGSPRLQGFLGIDVGFRDESSIIVGTVIDNKIYILDTFSSPYLTTKEFAKEIKDMMLKWQLHELALDFTEGAIYIDKSAALTSADLTVTYDIPTIPGYNKVRDGISLINTGFSSHKVFINEDLVELIDEIETLTFKENLVGGLNKNQGDPFIRVKGNHHDRVHAMRYLVTSLMMYWGIAVEETF